MAPTKSSHPYDIANMHTVKLGAPILCQCYDHKGYAHQSTGAEPADDLPICAGNFQGANKGKTCVIWTDLQGKTSCLYCLTEYTVE